MQNGFESLSIVYTGVINKKKTKGETRNMNKINWRKWRKWKTKCRYFGYNQDNEERKTRGGT